MFSELKPPSDCHSIAATSFKKDKKEKSKSKKQKGGRAPLSGGSKSDSSAGGSAGSLGRSSKKKKRDRKIEQAASKKARGQKVTFNDLAGWSTRGCVCKIRGVKDSDQSNLVPSKPTLWGYQPVLNTKKKTEEDWDYTTSGKLCYICTKVHMAFFYPEFNSTDMANKLGSCIDKSEMGYTGRNCREAD